MQISSGSTKVQNEYLNPKWERWSRCVQENQKLIVQKGKVIETIFDGSISLLMGMTLLFIYQQKEETYAEIKNYSPVYLPEYTTVSTCYLTIYTLLLTVVAVSCRFLGSVNDSKLALSVSTPEGLKGFRYRLLSLQYHRGKLFEKINYRPYHPIEECSYTLVKMGVVTAEVFKQLDALRVEREAILDKYLIDGKLKLVSPARIAQQEESLRIHLGKWNQKWIEFIPVLQADMPD